MGPERLPTVTRAAFIYRRRRTVDDGEFGTRLSVAVMKVLDEVVAENGVSIRFGRGTGNHVPMGKELTRDVDPKPGAR